MKSIFPEKNYIGNPRSPNEYIYIVYKKENVRILHRKNRSSINYYFCRLLVCLKTPIFFF